MLIIKYLYALEKLIGFEYNNKRYFYERNIQGDILKIYQISDESSILVAEYIYDAWGNHKVINHTSENIGDVNPFRYRGYYFDSETGLYYLNSRYYSHEMGRFISPDEFSILDETRAQINGLNWYETICMSALMGTLNIFAGLGSAMSTIAGNMSRVTADLNSRFVLRFLAGLTSGGTEAVYDLTSYILGKLISTFQSLGGNYLC